MRRVEWVTVHVRWRKVRGGGLKGDGGVVDVAWVGEYLEGRRMVMGGFDVEEAILVVWLVLLLHY